MRAGISPEAQNSQGGGKERKSVRKNREVEKEESRVKAQIVRLPAWLTLEETDYEKQWEAKRA